MLYTARPDLNEANINIEIYLVLCDSPPAPCSQCVRVCMAAVVYVKEKERNSIDS